MALFRHFCVSKVITTVHAHKSGDIFHIFPRAFKQKKIKALHATKGDYNSLKGSCLRRSCLPSFASRRRLLGLRRRSFRTPGCRSSVDLDDLGAKKDYEEMLAIKWRLGTDEDALVLRLNVQANFPGQRSAPAGSLTGHKAMRSLPDGSISGLLRKCATANSFSRASYYSWSSNGNTSTTVWQKIRSVPHFLQPPAIDKEPESNAKMFVNQRRDEMARTWKHILSVATKMVSAPLVRGILQGGQQVSSTIQMYTARRGRGTILVAIESIASRAFPREIPVRGRFFFKRRFQPLSVGGFFSNQRESISQCPKSPFPSKTQNRQMARTSPWSFFILFVRALGAHPVPGISLIFKRKTQKKSNKPRLRNYWVLHLEIAKFTMEQIRPQPCQHVDFLWLPWVKVYRKEPSAFIDDEHSRECTMFHFDIYRHSICFHGCGEPHG